MTEEQENELICEHLLGWQRIEKAFMQAWYIPKLQKSITGTPDFRAWYTAGQLLEALQQASVGFISDRKVAAAIPILDDLCVRLQRRLLGPPAIRQAALEYVRATLGE